MTRYYRFLKIKDDDDNWIDIKSKGAIYTDETITDNDRYAYVEVPEETDVQFLSFSIVDNAVVLGVNYEVRRDTYLENIRGYRRHLLNEADYEINKLIDTEGDASSWRTYRQALRDITESYLADMGLLDAVSDIETDVSWPVKPS